MADQRGVNGTETLTSRPRRARASPRGVRLPQLPGPYGHLEVLGCATPVPHTTTPEVTAWEIVLHHAPSATPSPCPAARRPCPHVLYRVRVPILTCLAFMTEHWSPCFTRLAIKRRHAVLLAWVRAAGASAIVATPASFATRATLPSFELTTPSLQPHVSLSSPQHTAGVTPLTGAELLAVAAPLHRRAPSPAAHPPQPTLGIEPQVITRAFYSLSRPSRAFPSPELRSLRRPWCQGPNCNLISRHEGLSAKSEDLFLKLFLLDLGCRCWIL
jgi:hypothetical protein